MIVEDSEKLPKVASKFYCYICHYNTSKKSSYDKHLSTDKHKNSNFETNETKKVPKSSIKFQCHCNAFFNSRTTLWRHKKNCSTTNDNNAIINNKSS
jgi:hypothetical protein